MGWVSPQVQGKLARALVRFRLRVFLLQQARQLWRRLLEPWFLRRHFHLFSDGAEERPARMEKLSARSSVRRYRPDRQRHFRELRSRPRCAASRWRWRSHQIHRHRHRHRLSPQLPEFSEQRAPSALWNPSRSCRSYWLSASVLRRFPRLRRDRWRARLCRSRRSRRLLQPWALGSQAAVWARPSAELPVGAAAEALRRRLPWL